MRLGLELLEYDPNWQELSVVWDHPGVRATRAEYNKLEAERRQLQSATYRELLPERLVHHPHLPTELQRAANTNRTPALCSP